MSKHRKKTLYIKKVTGPNPVPHAPHVATPPEKPWHHPDNILRYITVGVGVFSLLLSIVLSRDQLFTSREERLAMEREKIRLELEERYNLEKEKERQEQLEKERLEKERKAKEEAEKQRLAAEAKTKQAARKKRKKDPVGKFLKEVFG